MPADRLVCMAQGFALALMLFVGQWFGPPPGPMH